MIICPQKRWALKPCVSSFLYCPKLQIITKLHLFLADGPLTYIAAFLGPPPMPKPYPSSIWLIPATNTQRVRISIINLHSTSQDLNHLDNLCMSYSINMTGWKFLLLLKTRFWSCKGLVYNTLWRSWTWSSPALEHAVSTIWANLS